MGRTGKAKARPTNSLMESRCLLKAADLLNRLLISKLEVQVISTRARVLRKGFFDRLLYFQGLFDLLEGVEGDVVECGVAGGESLAMLASLVRSSNMSRHIWGFDCWEGLPAPSNKDLASAKSIAAQGIFSHLGVENVLTTLRWYGFDDSEIKNEVTLAKGLFSETLPKYSGPHIALLHIDADLYNSYLDCLRCLWPKVGVSGIVAFDEYQATDEWPGARQAVDEFFSQLAPGSLKLTQDTLFNRYYGVKRA